jgi:hypothetical protein
MSDIRCTHELPAGYLKGYISAIVHQPTLKFKDQFPEKCSIKDHKK